MRRPKGDRTRARVALLYGDAALIAAPETQTAYTGLLKDILAGRVAPPEKAEPGTKPGSGLPASDPAKPLPSAGLGGAKVYIATTQDFDGFAFSTAHDLLVLFPGGEAFDALPSALPAFTPSAIRQGLAPERAGTWTADARGLTVTLGGKPRVYRRVGEAWTLEPGATDRSAYGVFRRVIPLTPARLEGRWRSDESVTTSGFGMPTVTSGSRGRLTFGKGVYATEFKDFAGSSGDGVATVSEGSRDDGGRYRLDDGVLLTRDLGGRRWVSLAFLIPFFDGADPKTMWLAGRRWSRPEAR